MHKYLVKYESLVFNLPLGKPSEFMDHLLDIKILPKHQENLVASIENPLMINMSFFSCCYSFDGITHQYVTLKNSEPLSFEFDDLLDENGIQNIIQEVMKNVEKTERYILFTTNSHIFLPVTNIKIFDVQGNMLVTNIQCGTQPIAYRRWANEHELINLGVRTGMHLDSSLFESFLKGKDRYSRSFEYYINSFYEPNHASAFCMLCAAIDSITGKNGSNMTKQRLSKYSSVLFCAPMTSEAEEIRMKHYYSLRSKFVHGKGNDITEEDEINLREYVRKFLLAYYFFWQELKIKNEYQMLQILDKIYEDHSLYIKLVPVSYSFIALMGEHEKLEGGIFSLSMQGKYDLAVTKMAEAIISQPNSSDSSAENDGI